MIINRKKKYLTIDKIKKEELTEISHKDILIKLLENAKVKSKGKKEYILDIDSSKLEEFYHAFQEHDNQLLTYKNGKPYSISILTSNNKIVSIVIKEKDSNENIGYTFDKINEIPSIELPTNIE